MSDPFTLDGGILAGGLASRMQGKDKGLQLFKQKPMAEWVYRALSPYVRNVLINCNRNHCEYSKISGITSSDSIADFPGPLAGIVSIIQASNADYFLISPCDTPLLSSEFGTKMLHCLRDKLSQDQASKAPILFAVNTGEKRQPLHLCMSRGYEQSLTQYLDKGEHRVMKWMKDNHAQWLDFSEQVETFKNFNTLEDVNTY